MGEIAAAVGRDFLPMLAGGVAAPLVAQALPLGGLGALAVPALGLAAAIFGKGAVKEAGQGALIVGAVSLVAGMLGGQSDGFDF